MTFSPEIIFLLLALVAISATAAGMILYRYWFRTRTSRSGGQLIDQLQNEQFSSVLFDTLPDGFMVLDDSLTITTVNESYCRMTGRSKEEVIGERPPFPGWPKANWDEIENRVQDILKGKIQPFETAMYRKDGSSFPALFSVSKLVTIRDKTFYSVIIRDISEHVRIEQALRNSEEKFRAQFMSLPIPLFIWQHQESELVLIDFNDAADQITNGNIVRFLGISAAEIFENQPAILEDLRRCFREKISFQRDISYRFMTVHESKHLSVTYAYVAPDYVLVQTEDRTARVEAREMLEAREAQMRTVVESLPFGFFMIDESGRYSMVNSVITQQWGSDILGKTPEDVDADAETLSLWLENNRRAFSGEIVKEEVSFKIAGEKHVFYNIISPVYSGDKIKSILGVNIDITAQKLVEQELHESDARLRLMVEQLPAIMWTVDSNLRFTSSIGTGLETLNLLPGKVVGLSLYEYFKTDDPDFLPIAMHRQSLAGNPTTFEIKWNDHTWETHTEPLRDKSGAIIGCLAIALDITTRKQAEEISAQSRRQLRALAGRLREIREEESLNIARRIHDDLGQALTGLRWDITRLKKQMGQYFDHNSIPQFFEMIQNISSDIDATIQRVREIAVQLRPLILDDLGILGAFEWQINEFQNRTDIKCKFEHVNFDEQNLQLDSQHATVAFRILQEILSNVKRHADAHHIWIELRSEEKMLSYSVRDDGRGMSLNQVDQIQSLGILGMRERAQSIGGEVRIDSAEGEGTTVRVTIPT